MKEKPKLEIEYLPLSTIKPYKNNPREHSPKQISQIAKSIKQFGFTASILIDEDNEILAGHARLEAAKIINLKTVPTVMIKHLSDAEKKAYRVADNQLCLVGKWDFDLLKLEFAEIEKLENLDFSLDITGFETGEIDVILDGSLADKDKKLNEKDNTIPFIPKNEIISKFGDIWELGNHKILCGDALQSENYKKLLGDKKADMICVDFPYNLHVDSFACSGKIQHKNFAMAAGEMSSEEFQEFLNKNFKLLKEYSKNGSLHYAFMDWRHIKEIILAGTDIYEHYINLCLWSKDNAGMGSLYRSRHELIFIFKHGNRPHTNNVQLGSMGRYRTNIFEYPGVNSFGKNRENLKLHPTCKPVEMIKDMVLDVTNRGDLVLDSFLGSGTTLIASEKINRKCFAMEIEPLYVDTAIRRWQDLTGKSAVHVESGKTYRELLEIKKEKKNGRK
ncbi:MAG: ParB N-terminal domain-containing protein [Elusimicrobiaceae bacterium]|jgi:DNA modification methylase|nr:ParB N-terminal domain-containing protein [Elusimicrobiaceae bacterium]MBT3954836.1 ParB N-terminal domain-containing protein [Elusimicrobiaceae bacterium]MBT4008417.1 ParB N-terminal domain-containing protein [Elusimicrobiaceae bacterium]MBT4402945.1 ParB N-terminal domain-containing protein [Elusimicrobiaceae bacterium]MBT4439881.1 ParB N-terminal domain-containing protein [Elusimicrobiaceae bacterium]